MFKQTIELVQISNTAKQQTHYKKQKEIQQLNFKRNKISKETILG